MSVEQLRLDDTYGRSLSFSKFAGQIAVLPLVETIGDQIKLDNNQAHLLYLYLKEHLGLVQTDLMWLCNCGKWHKKGFTCERIAK